MLTPERRPMRGKVNKVVRKLTPERWRAPEIIPPKEKPIYVLNLPHGNDDRSNLVYLDHFIMEGIDHINNTKSDGRVAVMLEHATGTKSMQNLLRAAGSVENPTLSPSDIMQFVTLVHTLANQVPKTPKGLEGDPAYTGPTYGEGIRDILDHQSERFPGKILVVAEGHDDEVVKLATDPRLGEAFRFLKEAKPSDLSPEFYAKYREYLSIIAKQHSARDQSDAKTLAELAQDPEIAVIIKLHGAAHESGQILAQQGYNVENIYEEGERIPPPNEVLVQRLVKDPEAEISDVDIQATVEGSNMDVTHKYGETANGIRKELLEIIEERKKELLSAAAKDQDLSQQIIQGSPHTQLAYEFDSPEPEIGQASEGTIAQQEDTPRVHTVFFPKKGHAK